ncbi:cob(I)yrinic acid a,c-diamide adenosyltransferase [Candidatus Woesebacteria bacterium]|nr:cob(I)yrinic acid a,c-diamide adenosyltransferase [Candidatus Woesebacteria bacterium]
MSISTKTGDDGTTAIFGGKRLLKNDPQVEACGTVDEASGTIGLALEKSLDKHVHLILTNTQTALYLIMAYLSGAQLKKSSIKNYLRETEKEIVGLEKALPKLTVFILPQGSILSTHLHLARTVVRRAERRVAGFLHQKKQKTNDDKLILQYLNRLSDLLFLLARKHTEKDREV